MIKFQRKNLDEQLKQAKNCKECIKSDKCSHKWNDNTNLMTKCWQNLVILYGAQWKDLRYV